MDAKPDPNRALQVITDYLASRLRYVAMEMDQVAGLMSRFENREHWKRHGLELEGAARMAREWAEGLEREGRGEDLS
jgi:hypothetical protein